MFIYSFFYVTYATKQIFVIVCTKRAPVGYNMCYNVRLPNSSDDAERSCGDTMK